MKLFHFASQNTSQTLLRSPCHDSPRLNSPSKHVRPCYLFALIDGRSAALAARGGDSPLSDLLPLLPSAPRELTLTLLDRNVFTANSLWIFQWRMCWNDSSGNYRSGSRRGRTSNQEVTRWHTNAREVRFVLSFCTFLFYLLWMLRGDKRAVVDVIEFCALFVDSCWGWSEKETVRNDHDAWLHNCMFCSIPYPRMVADSKIYGLHKAQIPDLASDGTKLEPQIKKLTRKIPS